MLVRACLLDALLLNAAYFFGALVNPEYIPSPSAAAWIIVQALYLSFSFCFLFSDLLVPSLRLILHFLVTGIVFWLTCVLPGGYLKEAPTGIALAVCFVVYTCVYALAAAVVFLVRRLAAGEKNGKSSGGSLFGRPEAEEYSSQFAAQEPGKKKGKN